MLIWKNICLYNTEKTFGLNWFSNKWRYEQKKIRYQLLYKCTNRNHLDRNYCDNDSAHFFLTTEKFDESAISIPTCRQNTETQLYDICPKTTMSTSKRSWRRRRTSCARSKTIRTTFRISRKCDRPSPLPTSGCSRRSVSWRAESSSWSTWEPPPSTLREPSIRTTLCADREWGIL